MNNDRRIRWPAGHIATSIIALLAFWLTACSDAGEQSRAPAKESAVAITLDVYKSPTCGCCGEWIEHLEENGFTTTAHHPDDLDAVKQNAGISPADRSCHTAISTAGYVFEGHIPARYIRQFLSAPPAGAKGLVVPAMPVGSPGMEMGDRFDPYDVLLLKEDGSTEVFAHVGSIDLQYTP